MKRNHCTLPYFFSFFILVISAHAGWSQTPFSDSLLERLIRESHYKKADSLIKGRISSISDKEVDKKLYYYTKYTSVLIKERKTDSAMHFARQSILLAAITRDSALIAKAWEIAANSYYNSGGLDSSLIYSNLLMSYAKRKGDNKLFRNALLSFAAVLSVNRRETEALEYHREVIRIDYELKDSIQYPGDHFNIAGVFLRIGETDSARFHLEKAISMSKKWQKLDLLALSYMLMADMYQRLKEYQESEKYFTLANQVSERIGNTQFIALNNVLLCQISLMKKDYEKTIRYGNKALEIFSVYPDPVHQMMVDSAIFVALKSTGRYIEAIRHLESYIRLRNLVFNEKGENHLNELAMKLRVSEKDLLIANQQIEINHRKQNMQLLIFTIISLVILLSGFIVYEILNRRFRQVLFKKERDSDLQIQQTKEWMEWKRNLENDISGASTDKESKNELQIEQNDKTAVQNELFCELRNVFERQKLYLNPELNLPAVIKILGTNKKYLYQAISSNSDDNFRSFINRYRISEAKRILEARIEKGEEINMEELSTLCGFNSNVSFYRAFKSVTGLTPKEYSAEIKRVSF